MSEKNVIVIGAGLSGLAAAALLAKDGFHVTVIEKNEFPGGRTNALEIKGYRFEPASPWYLMPELFEKFFKQFDKNAKDLNKISKLSPSYRIFMNEGKVFDVSDRLSANIKAFNEIEPQAGEKLVEYLADANYKYKIFVNKVASNSFSSLKDLFDRDLAFDALRLQFWRSFYDHLRSYFKSQKLIDVLSVMSLTLGSSPKRLPSFYSLISHADLDQKVWYPQGGIGTLVDNLMKLCVDLNVEFIFNEEIIKIKTEDGKIKSLVAKSSNLYETGSVIVNADYAYVETRLLDHEDASITQEDWSKKAFAPSAIVASIGIDKKLKDLLHYNIFLDTDVEVFFDELFEKKVLSEKPIFYLTVPSRTDSSAAPKGSEALSISIPIPAGLNVSQTEAESIVKKVVERIEERVGIKLENNVVVEDIQTGRYFVDHFNAFNGSASGLSHALGQGAYFRPGIKNKKVEGLYHVGASTNPGIGLASQLISGQLGVEMLKSDLEIQERADHNSNM